MKFKVGQSGYYRVNYPEENWIAFGDLMFNWAMQSKTNPSSEPPLPTADRVNLLNDAFSLASAHRLSYSIALNLTKYLVSERELAPWETALDELRGKYMKSSFTSLTSIFFVRHYNH